MSGSGEGGGGFAPAVVLGLALAGFAAFIAFVVLGAFQEDPSRGSGAHALSNSAVGYSGMVRLLNATGRYAEALRGDPGHLGGEDSVMVVTIDRGMPRGPLTELATTRNFNGPILAVAPKWLVYPMRGGKPGWVQRLGVRSFDADAWLGERNPAEDERIVAGADRTERPRRLRGVEAERDPFELTTGSIHSLQVFRKAPGWTPVIVDEAGGIVLMRRHDRRGREIYALSDPDLLNNQGIAERPTAAAGLLVLGEVGLGGPVYFDTTLHGLGGTASALRTLLTPPFLPATLCVLATALLMFWHALYRFGPARRETREIALGKQALADNQAGLIRMAGREPAMAPRYVGVVRALAARAVGAPKQLSPEALEAFLDRLGAGGRTHQTLTDLKAEAAAVRDAAGLVENARRLHRWRLEMTRERD